MTETDAAAAEDIHIDLAGLPADELVEWLQSMLLIRRFEERAERLGSRGAIPGGIHSAAGQEAVAVGDDARAAPGRPGRRARTAPTTPRWPRASRPRP